MTSRSDILAKVKSVPALPIAAVEVMSLAQDPEVGMMTLRNAIERDPGLTSNLLRLVNSAYFGGRGQISTIQETIVRLGLKRISQLVIASAVSPIARQPMKGYDMPPGDLLNHSVMVAVAAEELARACNIKAPDHTFTAGLLHDIGKIVLGTFIEVDAKDVIDLAFKESTPFHIAESRVLGMDHPEVGAVLLESWRIPKPIVEVVRWHHEPDKFPDDSDSLVVDLVHVADHLCRTSGIGTGMDGLNYAPSKRALERFSMSIDRVEEVVLKALGAFQDLIESFPTNSER